MGRDDEGDERSGPDDLLNELQYTRDHLAQTSARLETVENENKRLQKKLEVHEGDQDESKRALIEELSKLKGQLEQSEWKIKQSGERFRDGQSQVEKLTILAKDKDKRLLSLEEEVNISISGYTLFHIKIVFSYYFR